MENILRGILGVCCLVCICYLLSNNRKYIDWKLVLTGLAIQLLFALLVLKVEFVRTGFSWLANFFVLVIGFTRAGTEFLFGSLVTSNDTIGYIFAFQVLPTVIFFSALTSLLYYLGVLQKIVFAFAWVMSKTMRLSGAESLSTAGNIFLGQTESPLLVKPFLATMTKSELLCVMVGGMATIAGGVMAAYIGFLGGDDIERQKFFAMHLLSASIMSAPAAIVASKMLYPQVDQDKVNQNLKLDKSNLGTNPLEAIANGTTEGLKLAVNVGAMLIVFTAFMAMFNYIFMQLGFAIGVNDNIVEASNGKYTGLTLQFILGYAFMPFAWILGVPNQDILAVGQLLGEKTILNEFVAYTSLGNLQNGDFPIQEKSLIIVTYALCGFSNFASIGIQIGGIGALAPNQKSALSQLGIRALIGGTIACFFTASMVGMII